MIRKTVKPRKEKDVEREIPGIYNQKTLERMAFDSQRELPSKLEALLSIQNDTKITEKRPAHYYRYLYFLSVMIKPKLSVELGTWHGLSTACLADGNPEGKVITIDKDEVVHQDAVRPNVEYWHQVGTMKLKHDVENIDILFIDAEHNGSCFEEYRFWMPRMKNRSVILFDDINVNDAMKAFWKSFNPTAGRKFDLPIHGEAGFGAVLINN